MAQAIRIRMSAGCLYFAFASIALLAADRAQAAGFALPLQSAGAASVSSAGQTAIARDAATVYYNAAGMTQLDKPQLLAVSALVLASHSFDNSGTAAALGDPAKGQSGDRDETFLIPSLFATTPISDRLSVGLGLFSPFGQSNTYTDDWVGRYHLQRISLKVADIDLAVAYRLTDTLSVGGGIDLQYARLTRKNALDLGALCIVSVGPSTCSGLGLGPQGADGRLTASGADWNVGFNVGLLYDDGFGTHIGVNYRSAVRHDFSGTARFDVPANAMPLTAGGQFQNTGLHSVITFPDIAAFGISHKIDDRFTVLADFNWVGWSRIRQLTLDFTSPLQPDQGLALNWKDSVRGAIGGIYSISADTDVSAGISYDQTPVSRTFRSADLPDSDEIMISAGVLHRFTESFSMTFSYSYGDYAAAPTNLALMGAGLLSGTFHRNSNAIALDVQIGL